MVRRSVRELESLLESRLESYLENQIESQLESYLKNQIESTLFESQLKSARFDLVRSGSLLDATEYPVTRY